jgi:hypothetical protein
LVWFAWPSRRRATVARWRMCPKKDNKFLFVIFCFPTLQISSLLFVGFRFLTLQISFHFVGFRFLTLKISLHFVGIRFLTLQISLDFVFVSFLFVSRFTGTLSQYQMKKRTNSVILKRLFFVSTTRDIQ